jgi:hypothetical protein
LQQVVGRQNAIHIEPELPNQHSDNLQVNIECGLDFSQSDIPIHENPIQMATTHKENACYSVSQNINITNHQKPGAVSKNLLIFAGSFGLISLFLFLFIALLRKDGNSIIPSALILHFLAFVVTPTIFILKNGKLKKFVLDRFKFCYGKLEDLNFKTSPLCKARNNQIQPYAVTL